MIIAAGNQGENLSRKRIIAGSPQSLHMPSAQIFAWFPNCARVRQIQEVHLRLTELSRDFSCCQQQGNLSMKFKAGLVNFLLKQSRLFERIKQNPVSLRWLFMLSGINSEITRHRAEQKKTWAIGNQCGPTSRCPRCWTEVSEQRM